MKNLLLTTIAIITLGSFAKASDEAFNSGADQMNDVIICHNLTLQQESDLKVTVSTGGIAGLTQVRVERFVMADTSVENYIVRLLPVDPRALVSTTTYIGSGIRLTVNFVKTLPNGENYGTLQLQDHDLKTIEKLSCALVQQNPQVNYTY